MAGIDSRAKPALSSELTLEQMLQDEIVRLVMKRDGVTELHIRALFAKPRPGSATLPRA